MATSTTNYSFSLPEVGGDTDQWGTQLNANWTLADSTLKTIEDSVVDVTLTGNDYLTISGQAITVGDVDLTADVTGTLPVASGGTGLAALGSANQVLGVNSGGTALEYKTLSTGGTVTSVAVTGSDGIEIDSGSPITSSGTIALGINATSLSTHLGLGTAATTDSTAYATSTQGSTADSALQDVVDDGDPQLGGNLDVVTYSIVSTSARDINITPDTTGNVVLGNFSFDADQTVGLSEDNYVLTYNNTSGLISLEAASVTESQISDFGSYQAADAGLQSISGLTTAANKMIYTTASDTYAVADLTAAGRAILDDADAEAQRATLGLGSAATTATTDYATSAQGTTADSALQDVVSDTTPQLGGDLDVNGNSIVSASNGNIAITPNGTGNVSLGNFTFDADQTVGAGQDDYVLTYDHSTTSISLEAASGGGISDIVSDTTPQLGGNLDVNGNSIVSVSAGNISITPDTTGQIILDGLSWPTSDGTTDQVLKTDGAGNLSFVNQSALVVGTANYIEHSSTVSDSLAISSGTNRMYIGNTTFSGSGTMAGYLVISHGYANFTGASALNVTGILNVAG